ncbi:MAG TPA: hypothetical protein VJ890_22210 [Vineibacter sp.]|nr:hypothetical protein [Vineibacter sp.]
MAGVLLAIGLAAAAQAQELRELPWRNRGTAPPPVVSPPPTPDPAPHSAGSQPTSWKAVLVAGDDAQHVFSNAIAALRRQLTGFGVAPTDISVLTADSRDRATIADRANFDAQSARLVGPAGSGCFVFITSHGQRNEGLYLKRARIMLAPAHLDFVVNRGCGDRPTVVVTSGCYSGLYTDDPGMRRANRILLTAARADRTSFGCSNDYQFTFYDHCFLDSLRRGEPWTAIAQRVRACVERRESQVDAIASFPQTFFGPRVAGLTAF